MPQLIKSAMKHEQFAAYWETVKDDYDEGDSFGGPMGDPPEDILDWCSFLGKSGILLQQWWNSTGCPNLTYSYHHTHKATNIQA